MNNRKIILTVAAGCIGTAAHAQSSIALYGLVDAGITYVNNAATSTGHDSLVKYGDGVAQGSRWGIRGSEDLGGGTKAIFVLESGFSSADGSSAQGGALFGRHAAVGIAQAGVGTLTFGRQYSLSDEYIGGNYTMGNQTVAGNYAFHINDLDQLTASRINNSVKFSSANYAGLQFGALYGFSNQAGSFAGTPTTTVDGVKTQGSSSTYSFGANYAAGSFAAGAAYTNIRYPNGASPAFSVSVANVDTGGLRDLQTFGVGARYRLARFTVWGNWTRTWLSTLTNTVSTFNNYEIGGKYAISPALSAGVGYTFSQLSGQYAGRWNQINTALDYALSKTTDVYAVGVYQRASGSNFIDGKWVPVQAEIGSSTSFIGNSGTGARSQLALRIGLRHKF